jgi:hypothetical protein
MVGPAWLGAIAAAVVAVPVAARLVQQVLTAGAPWKRQQRRNLAWMRMAEWLAYEFVILALVREIVTKAATVAHAVGEKPSIDGGGRGDAFRNRRRRWSRPDRDPGVTRRMRVGEVLAHRRVVRVRRDRDQGEAVAVSAG